MISLKTISEKRPEIIRLARKYRTTDVRVFGSVARGTQGISSDVDFLVHPEPGCSLFDLGGFLEDLQDLLNCRVDIVTDADLKPRLREQVLREAIAL